MENNFENVLLSEQTDFKLRYTTSVKVYFIRLFNHYTKLRWFLCARFYEISTRFNTFQLWFLAFQVCPVLVWRSDKEGVYQQWKCCRMWELWNSMNFLLLSKNHLVKECWYNSPQWETNKTTRILFWHKRLMRNNG